MTAQHFAAAPAGFVTLAEYRERIALARSILNHADTTTEAACHVAITRAHLALDGRSIDEILGVAG